MVAFLLAHEATIDAVDADGHTAFSWAASHEGVECAAALGEAGADTLLHLRAEDQGAAERKAYAADGGRGLCPPGWLRPRLPRQSCWPYGHAVGKDYNHLQWL